MEKIDQAFVLAAGFGTRMRPLTDNCPKPLLEVNGITMLDRALNDLKTKEIKKVMVNCHYLSEMVEEHLKLRGDKNIELSIEDEILETAGGVKKEIHKFENSPMFVLNPDIICKQGSKNYLDNLSENWEEDKMDILLLLYPKKILVEKNKSLLTYCRRIHTSETL